MLQVKESILQMINSPSREIKARVELLNGSTLVDTFSYADRLINFSVERVKPQNKFFGFGICQKLTVKLLDKNRELNITKENSFDVAFGVNGDYTYLCPIFHVEEVTRDEKTNELTIVAYDVLYRASNHSINEIEIDPYSLKELSVACAALLGIPYVVRNVNDNSFDLEYPERANFDGSETIREVLDYIAEATQTIYYVCSNLNLTFKRLDKDGKAVLTVDKSKYFELNSRTDRTLTGITHATELGDNVTATTGATGVTQYVRENPFWELRDDIGTLLNNAIATVGGLTINQLECQWRGNFLLEIGDKIDFITKDDKVVTSYLLDDTLLYDGGMKQTTAWSYEDNESETPSNPVTIGDSIKQTYARVDKVNKRIDLVASEVSSNTESISALQINTDSISASVSKIEKNATDSIDAINSELGTLTKRVEASMTAEDVKIQIKSELDNGVTKVETNTGFTFDDEGLTIDKSGSEMKTQITEDGMTVYKNDEAVLVANNVGVEAKNLHATTYLIIGTHSRFEDYQSGGEARTGCFWIGG